MTEHTHPSQHHDHRHYHLQPYFVGMGPGQDWEDRFVWHTHPHDHLAEIHDHTFTRSEEERHHDRFAHTHEHHADEPAGRLAAASADLD